VTSVGPLPPGRAEVAGAPKREAPGENHGADGGFGDVLDAGKSAPPSRKKQPQGESADAAAAAAIAGMQAPGQAPARLWGRAEGSADENLPEAGNGGELRPPDPMRRQKSASRSAVPDPRQPAAVEQRGRPAGSPAAEAPRLAQPAWGNASALPPELASLLAGGKAMATFAEGDEPSSPDAEAAPNGSSLSRLNAAVASLELGGLDARHRAASERHARDGGAGSAAGVGEREDAPRFGFGDAEETPEPAGEPRDAVAARFPAASVPANPAGLAVAVSATPGAIAETLAANLPEAARPAGPLPAELSRPADPTRVLTLELKPDTLGPVTARLRLEETRLAVEITVATAEARDRLGPDGGEIARALEALGLSVDRVTVSLNETSPSRDDAAGRGPAGEDRFAASGDRAGRGEGGGGGPRHGDGAGRTGGGLGPGADRPGSGAPPGEVYI